MSLCISGCFAESVLSEQQLLEQQCSAHEWSYKACFLFRKRTLIDIYRSLGDMPRHVVIS
ncbi:hypothetical protein EMIT0347P_60341 [Pseudomonas sp. IT-347P]